jgi:hypothetical protein
MNQKLLIASTLVIVAAFAISFAAAMENQASAQRPDRNVAQNAQNEINQGSNAQRGLVNLGNTAVDAQLQLNCAVNVISDCQ